MWIIYAFGSAFFAGITAVLAKIGIKNTDSNLAIAIRTIVILIGIGTYMIIEKKKDDKIVNDNKWFFFAIG